MLPLSLMMLSSVFFLFGNKFISPSSAFSCSAVSSRGGHSVASRWMSSLAALVSVDEAIEAQKSGEGRFIDGSWFMPVGENPRNGRAEFAKGPRIRDACYLDIDDIGACGEDNPKSLPHMKPTAKQFAVAMDRMKISPGDTIYVYATKGCGFYHRAYWTLSSCGFHDPGKVKLLQGCLDEFRERGGEVEEGKLVDGEDHRLFRLSEMEWRNMTPKYKCWSEGPRQCVVDRKDVLEVVKSRADAVIVDARSSGRFVGTAPEPRPGLRGGHMPGALNVPFTDLLDPMDMTKFKPLSQLKKIFESAGVKAEPSKTIVTCGSGVTAAALAVGIEECGLRNKDDILIYDGSWIEWGGDESVPIVKDS